MSFSSISQNRWFLCETPQVATKKMKIWKRRQKVPFMKGTNLKGSQSYEIKFSKMSIIMKDTGGGSQAAMSFYMDQPDSTLLCLQAYCNYHTWITTVPTFSLSITTGLKWAQSTNFGALLLMSLTSTMSSPLLRRLVVPPQQPPLSTAVTLSLYDTCDFSNRPTRVRIPDLGSMLNGPFDRRPPKTQFTVKLF